MSQGRRIPGWISGAVVLGAFGLLVWAETRRPLREQREGKARRDIRNLTVAALSAATLQALEKPVVEPLSQLVERRRWGLLKQLQLPPWIENLLAVALMDYTLYLWHVLVHRLPFLWRFHQVHHADLDMDTSTALRFHFAEMAVSVPYRAAQVAILGVAPRPLSIWQTFLLPGRRAAWKRQGREAARFRYAAARIGFLCRPRRHHSLDPRRQRHSRCLAHVQPPRFRFRAADGRQ